MSLVFMDPMTDQLLANDKNFPEVSIIMPRFNGGILNCVHRQSQKSTKWTKIAKRNQRMGILIMAIRR
jgi:hypothetical protein